MDRLEQQLFWARHDALGTSPNKEQQELMVQWVIENIGITYWGWCGTMLLDVCPDCYTELQMRYMESEGWRHEA